MTTYRALLMSGACCLGLVAYQATSRDALAGLPATFKDLFARDPAAVVTDLVTVAEGDAPAEPATEAAAPAENAPAATSSKGLTEYFGTAEAPDAERPWAAAATMNADYTATESPPKTEAPAAEEAAAPAAQKASSTGVTEFYGYAAEDAEPQAWAEEAEMNPDYATDAADEEPAAEAEAEAEAPAVAMATPAWAAEATMNPDYSAEEPAPAVEATAAAEPEAAPVSLGGQGVTEFYGVSDGTARAWSAEATVFPDTPAPAPAAETTAVVQEAVEACRDALNGEVQTGRLLFGTASWDIDRSSYKTLDKLAKVAKNCNAAFVIEVGGHTDNTGKPVSNKTLSDLRAQEVVKYLVKEGVDAAKLKAVGYGQERPIATNDNRDGRRQNRRIEFLVTSAGS
jgi:outer membrane protein OmpA-like peptidoglycan-associated protein